MGKSDAFQENHNESEVTRLLHELLDHTKEVANIREKHTSDILEIKNSVNLLTQRLGQYEDHSCSEECFPKMRNEIKDIIAKEFNERKIQDTVVLQDWWQWRNEINRLKWVIFGGGFIILAIGSWFVSTHGKGLLRIISMLSAGE